MDNEQFVAQVRELLSPDSNAGYEKGFARHLISRRNGAVLNLIASDRAVFYCNIAYRMLLFRREHELEPLHEDLYRAVCSAQERFSGEFYPPEQFLIDMNQLETWRIVTLRLEKERIRGYKDTRRTKYRYGLDVETVNFLLWLEERLRDDIEDRTSDARDLLEEVAGTLREVVRLLRLLASRKPDENEARRVLFQIFKLQQTTAEIAASLSDFNARLLGFLICDYDLRELGELLRALHTYVDKYLIRIAALRRTLLPDLKTLDTPGYRVRLRTAWEIMEAEKRAAPRQFRSQGETIDPSAVPRSLVSFFREHGALDKFCHRINDSALRVWQRMSTHLKELERKSNRIEDLRERMLELSAKPEEFVPRAWLNNVLSWGHIRADMHHWDDQHRADPPRPRKVSWQQRSSPVMYLKEKAHAGEAVQSMEQTRLNLLKDWISRCGLTDQDGSGKLSLINFTGLSDMARVIELARAGILGNGKKLRSIGFEVNVLDEMVLLIAQEQRIRCREMVVSKTDTKGI